ncbi:helix-turn-helix domain-containing protein [Roseibium sp. MB-4]
MDLAQLTLKDCDEIEEFFLTSTGMKPGFIQLSAGLINLSVECVDLDGVTVIWSGNEGCHRWRDEAPETGLHFAFAVSAEEPILFQGREVDQSQMAMWQPEAEMDFLMKGKTASIDIGIEQELLDELGWNASGPPVVCIPEETRARLTSTCKAIRSAAERQSLPIRPEYAQAIIRAWRDQLLDDLRDVVMLWGAKECPAAQSADRPTPYQLIRLAETFFNGLPPDQMPDMKNLSKEIGVSRRSLFRAFQEHLGLGPRRYFELKRLNMLRRDLKAHVPEEATVTDLALKNGFVQFGRLSQLYKNQFGELPSTTLRTRSN